MILIACLRLAMVSVLLLLATEQTEQIVQRGAVPRGGQVPISVALLHCGDCCTVPRSVHRVVGVNSRPDFADGGHTWRPAPIATDVGDMSWGGVIAIRVNARYLSRGHD